MKSDSEEAVIVWFRQDLRLEDHPALVKALSTGAPIIPVFIWAPEEDGIWPPGGASQWWLHHSLECLDQALRAIHSRLIIRRGPSLKTLLELAHETGAKRVFFSRLYEPAARERDRRVSEALSSHGIACISENAALLHEPWNIQNKSGKPFQVFTPFWKSCLTLEDPAFPLEAPIALPSPERWPDSLPLKALSLLPKIPWDGGIRDTWKPGPDGAKAALAQFCTHAFTRYSESRNIPAIRGTSRLSPYLHFGEISPRQVWHGIRTYAESNGISQPQWRSSQFLAEVGWREFSHHLLVHFPSTPTEPLRPEFRAFPWRKNDAHLQAWQRGQTGYPIVDAGMRELWATGWMHNRVRMIVASFLVKDLLIPWQEGARWFWDTLVDADLAQNTLGWQWTAGCGADAAPYFRVFNPTSQGEKFDPEGKYISRWIPELAQVPAEWIHQPTAAPSDVRSRAGVVIGKTYPWPIVDHGKARLLALSAFEELKGKKGELL